MLRIATSKPKFMFCFQEIKSIVDTGVNCIVSGGKVGEMALHFCNKFNILVVRSVWISGSLCFSFICVGNYHIPYTSIKRKLPNPLDTYKQIPIN